MRRCLVVTVLCAAACAALAALPGTMSVQVRHAPLRDRPSHLGTVVAQLAYADPVQVLAQQGPWVQVSGPAGPSGWLHESALSKKRIVLSAGAQDVQGAASGAELALAGKGFNADVEQAFRAGNSGADYTWVDRMEALRVDEQRIEAFLREGGVAPREGGAQ